MRILIVTAGSRGDVAPYTGLGRRLQQAGHQVALAAHDRFADPVRECGLEHRALPGDPVELVRARTAAPSPEAARSVFGAFLDELGEGVLAAVEAGTDLLLTAFGPAPLGRLVAEGFGIPSAGVYLAPGVPTQEFAPPGWPIQGQRSPGENLAAGHEMLARTGSLYADVLRRMRARLDLPAVGPEAAAPRRRRNTAPVEIAEAGHSRWTNAGDYLRAAASDEAPARFGTPSGPVDDYARRVWHHAFGLAVRRRFEPGSPLA